MSQNRKARQRTQRRENRQIKAVLTAQAYDYGNTALPIFKNVNLDNSFRDYAIRETKREIREHEIDDYRKKVLEKAIHLSIKKVKKP
jgi:hypothetical protein